MPLYNTIGQGYSEFRRPDPRIAFAIDAALGDTQSVVNVGAGAGSYEPRNRSVLAIEPSDVMIRQRAQNAAPCVQGFAESLPLETASTDAAMAILSVHHWSDLEQGLREMARVARKRVVLFTWVPPAGLSNSASSNIPPDPSPFWLTEDYFPEILSYDRTIFPSSATLVSMLESLIGPVRMAPVPIPHDCEDGMLAAYWRRPDLYLSPERRAAISSFARIDAEPGLAKLRAELTNGCWLGRNKHLLSLNEFDAGYRLITCHIRAKNAMIPS